MPQSLYDYGLIGNAQTAALVSRHGSIDWACFPRFDSPSVFARLLDPEAGGFARVAPEVPYSSHQQYVPATNILSTRFVVRRGVVLTVTDFMPTSRLATGGIEEPRILRRLSARGEPIPTAIEIDARFDYARIVPAWSVDHRAAEARAGDDRLHVVGPWSWKVEGPRLSTVGPVEPGAPVYVQLAWGDSPPATPSPEALLGVTDAFWRGWVAPEDAPMRRVAARWHPWVERSELVLKLLSYSHTGVFVAAPTTSLPEWPGGPRNWDYRYVWIRDAAFTAQIFLLLGHVAEARGYVAWAFDRAAAVPDGGELGTLYAVDGQPPPAEQELSHLRGFQQSTPVRVGNGAADQRQLDIYGELLDSASLLERVDPAFVRDRWPVIERIADQTVRLWSEPDRGIWEFRTAPAHYVHSKLMCWVALDRAIRLAEAFGRPEAADRWKRSADEIRAAILARGFDASQGAFVQSFGSTALDASSLRIPLTGFLPPTDPRVVSTVAAIEGQLGDGPFVRRYATNDGLDGPEGRFLLCSFWLVECLARGGQSDRALGHWRALLDAAGPLLLFSEQFDPASNRPLGNYPQAFTHIGVLRAALALGLVASDE